MLNSQETRILETSYDRVEIEITFQQYRENLAKAGEFSDGLQVIMNIKDITIPLIIHYYLLKHSEHYTNLSTLNHNVRFLPCQHRGVGIMQYVYALQTLCASF